MSWNYRVTREMVTNPDETTAYLYAVREVYYDDEGKPNGWGKEPATFAGDTPGEVIESLLRASGSFPSGGVFDMDTRETVHVTYYGSEVVGR